MIHLKLLSAGAITALLTLLPASASSREAIPAAPGTVTAPVLAFAGGWETIMNRRERYTLVLQISTPVVSNVLPDLQVSGQILNTDGEFNGTVQGVIPMGTRTLQFSFTQPSANRAGTGQLILSQDGSSISGSGKAGDVWFTWRGTRAR